MKRQVGRLVAAQRRAGLLPAQFGAQRSGFLAFGRRLKTAPAVVKGLARVGGEAVCQLAGCAPALDGVQGHPGRVVMRRGRTGKHGATV